MDRIKIIILRLSENEKDKYLKLVKHLKKLIILIILLIQKNLCPLRPCKQIRPA